MQSNQLYRPNGQELQGKKAIRSSEWMYGLYLLVLCLLFLFRDVLGVSVPLPIFIGYFTIGFMAFDYDHLLALTAMMPLLGHGIQTNYLILIAIVFYLLKRGGGITVRRPMVLVLILILYELFHVLIAGDSISEYLRYVVQYFFVGLVLGETRAYKLLKKPIVILKTFIFMAVYFMLDVILVTLQHFTFEEMFADGFRFGQLTELIGDKPSLGDNENMVALFAIVAISLVIVCMFAERKHYILYSAAIVYFTFFGLFTGSKTFLICLLLLGVCALLFLFKKSVVKATAIISGIILGGYVLIKTLLADALKNVLLRFEAEDISTGRGKLLRLYNEFIFSNPIHIIFGVGLQEVDVKANIHNTPHNAIQEVVLCWGIIGLVLVALLCWELFRQHRCSRNRDRFIYLLPFLIFLIFIQTIQFVRLSSIFGLLVLFYVVILMGGMSSETTSISDHS